MKKSFLNPTYICNLKNHRRHTLDIEVALEMQRLTGEPASSFVSPFRRKMFESAYKKQLFKPKNKHKNNNTDEQHET